MKATQIGSFIFIFKHVNKKMAVWVNQSSALQGHPTHKGVNIPRYGLVWNESMYKSSSLTLSIRLVGVGRKNRVSVWLSVCYSKYHAKSLIKLDEISNQLDYLFAKFH